MRLPCSHKEYQPLLRMSNELRGRKHSLRNLNRV